MTLSPLKAAIKRALMGRKKFDELTYKAVTVLVRSTGELKIQG
jgi:hypothetical protein